MLLLYLLCTASRCADCFFLAYISLSHFFLFFFFNDTATTEIYPLSLHDALPIWPPGRQRRRGVDARAAAVPALPARDSPARSEEHTSELQSPCNLVCRLLLEKKKKYVNRRYTRTKIDIATVEFYTPAVYYIYRRV